MDILDIMIAKAMTPQGKTDTYVAKANAAAAKAEKAEQDAAAAISLVNDAAEDIENKVSSAETLLETAQNTMEVLQAEQLDTEDVQAEIKKLDVSINTISDSGANVIQAVTTYPDNTSETENITKLYKSTGANEDGTMTQKAISEKLNFGAQNAGKFITVDAEGNMQATVASVPSNPSSDTPISETTDIVGLEIDYENKSYERLSDAVGLEQGEAFNRFKMYGGRMRCNVNDDGAITAFYGDPNYDDTGVNGQVMIYQPKFYYKRMIVKSEAADRGRIVRKERLYLSDSARDGFKLHPAFISGDTTLDYVLLPAYDGALENDKLVSISGVQPIANISITAAENYAKARGTGWHISTLAVESAMQMLQMVEYGNMNGQLALEQGISNFLNPPTNVNYSSITGSTAALGNATGHAESTDNTVFGAQTEAGKRAISYRGSENPWGNLWRFVGDVIINGDKNSHGGQPYICTDFNYSGTTIGNNYEPVGFDLPNDSSWISAMGYGDAKYDWVYMPAEAKGNSAVPVGDSLWVNSSSSYNTIVGIGGSAVQGASNGMFYYACDRNEQDGTKLSYGANLIFIPTKNAVYDGNYAAWLRKMGG